MTPLNDPRTKKLAITIALCGTALITDRFVLGPPSEAAASPESQPAVLAAAVSLAAADAAASDRGDVLASPERTVDPRRVLADRLRAAADREAGEMPADLLSRVFQARPSWESIGDEPLAAAAVPVLTEPEARRRARFQQETRLTGVMHTAEGGGAWINGVFVPIGGVIDGFTLVATGPRSVTFERGGEPLELLMGGPMDSGRGGPAVRNAPAGGQPSGEVARPRESTETIPSVPGRAG